ncbi:DUF2802 domain-containing protein [Bdellovibrio sp. qaytius]|nr:DUF2802 domain-containing protein [Bdellovibrio sp. qaytius]
MNIWLLLLTFFNIVLLAGLSFSLFLRVREKKEDQRLTKGLQLLQNKISILEDLSDKTDHQVRKLIHILDQKTGEVRHVMAASDEQIQQIEAMLNKGLEISKIFHEQIPQGEMQNRQKTNLYVTAAKMAHQGYNMEQILAQVDLTPAEIQMIIKVNKDNLQFAEDQLPTWAQGAGAQSVNNNSTSQSDLNDFAQALTNQNSMFAGSKLNTTITETAFDSVKQDMTTQSTLTTEFKKSIQQMPQTFTDNTTTTPDGKVVRPFEFKRIIKSN